MNYMLIDTCVLVDIATQRKNFPIISTLEVLTESEKLKLIIPEIIIDEFSRNKKDNADKNRKRLSLEFKRVKIVVDEFGGDNKEQAIEILNDVNTRLPLLSEVTHAAIDRINKLICDSLQIKISEKVKSFAVQRGIEKKAPFHRNKNSMVDTVIMEQFSEFIDAHKSDDNLFFFITHNHKDFSSKDHRKPHEDFKGIFQQSNVHYFIDISSAIKIIDDEILEDILFEHDYMEETRGLQEILSAMDELFDKVWFNRHCNLKYEIENGDARIVPKGSQEHGNDIVHEDIWKEAIKAAQRVRGKYEDTGPWNDFEWGMLNGKLSALRWVLGDEWDMLDT